MKKIDLGQSLQLLGNAGVIVGILLLVYELNQNRDMMMAQTRHELSRASTEILFEMSNSIETVSLIRRGNAGEALTEDERERYRLMSVGQLRYHENVHYQFRNGLYDEVEYAAQKQQWRDVVFARKGFVELFCSTRPALSPDFVAEIEGLLTIHQCQ